MESWNHAMVGYPPSGRLLHPLARHGRHVRHDVVLQRDKTILDYLPRHLARHRMRSHQVHVHILGYLLWPFHGLQSKLTPTVTMCRSLAFMPHSPFPGVEPGQPLPSGIPRPCCGTVAASSSSVSAILAAKTAPSRRDAPELGTLQAAPPNAGCR